MRPRDLSERFWEKVEKTEGCWLWTASTRNGYGQIALGGRGNPVLYAHRVSYEMHHGPIPDGLVVMHTCDVRSCVRPDHLTVGTQAENLADMVAKGRSYRGPKPWASEANRRRWAAYRAGAR